MRVTLEIIIYSSFKNFLNEDDISLFSGNIRKSSASLKTSFKLDNIKKIKTIINLNFLRMRQKKFR